MELQAQGDQLRLERRSGAVAISCPGDLSVSIPREAHVSAGTIGGDARVENLNGRLELEVVGGDVVLRNLSGAVQINGVIGGDTRLENVANISMNSAGRGPGFDIAERIRRTMERATRRAETKIRRAEAKAYRYGHMGFRWSDTAEPTAAPAGEPVSDEERMTILRMLQDKKITSEQADQLLSALEGKA
jgi:hypothetical protein